VSTSRVSYVLEADPPEVSFTSGPFGTAGGAGGAPWPWGTDRTSSVRWSAVHWNDAPKKGLSLMPAILRAEALATSPTHNSTSSGVIRLKAKRFPSALHSGGSTLAPVGSAMCRTVPSPTFTRSRALHVDAS
jgi:hypothetical protein